MTPYSFFTAHTKRAGTVPSFFVLFLAAVLLLSLLPYILSAQVLTNENIALSVAPALPKPYDPVRLELSSFSVDLNRSDIDWFVDGSLELSGIGERVLETRVGGAGSATRVETRVTPVGGASITRSAVLRPAGVDILWHAHAYTPPFYRGKTLPPSRGFIVFTAIPELVDSRGVLSDPSTVVYTWRQLGVTLGNASGYGRERIVLEGEAVSQQPMNVSVIATSFDGALEASDSRNLRVRAPQILFYEKHPLEGVRLERALVGSFPLTKEEMTLRAEPFFFSLDDMQNNRLSYEWRVGGETVLLPEGKKNEIALRREGVKSGSVSVSLSIINDNLDKVLQEAVGSLRVNLEETSRF